MSTNPAYLIELRSCAQTVVNGIVHFSGQPTRRGSSQPLDLTAVLAPSAVVSSDYVLVLRGSANTRLLILVRPSVYYPDNLPTIK
jgi:hypothetical protein